MKDRIELARYFAELGFKTGAEVGVATGHYSCRLLGIIPNLKLYCVDCWDGKYARFEDRARKSLSKCPGADVIKGMSVDVAKTIPDSSLDFVYIDANHSYKSVTEDMLAWEPKVRSGGIISGHDYHIVDVKKAVDDYVSKHEHDLNITEEQYSSWWFVKTKL